MTIMIEDREPGGAPPEAATLRIHEGLAAAQAVRRSNRRLALALAAVTATVLVTGVSLALLFYYLESHGAAARP
jgi:hypothetical protein